MLSMAKSHLHDSQVKSIDDVMAEIESIKAEEIQEVANEILNPNLISTLIFKAREE